MTTIGVRLGRRAVAVTAALATVLAGGPAWAGPTAPEPAPLHGLGARDAIPGRYLVVFKDGVSAKSRTAAERTATTSGNKIHFRYGALLHGFSATLSGSALAGLRRDPSVAFVEIVRTMHVDGTQYQVPSWGLDRIDQRSANLDGRYEYHATGYGVTVYVIDSGIRTTNAEFEGRARDGWDFVDNDPVAEDCTGHGTHVAGTIAGRTVGVAKQARVVSLRMFDCDGDGSGDRYVMAMDWIFQNHPRGTPAVINFSGHIGGPAIGADRITRLMVEANFTFVAAAGNNNGDACDTSPARVPEAITVGATGGGDARANFPDWGSNWGPCLDLFAPGVGINSASNTADHTYQVMSGTSMATPHVAGMAALYLHAHPAANPQQVRDALVDASTGGVVGDPGNGSPNRLLYRLPPPGIAIPNGGMNNLFNSYGDRAGCADWSGADATQSVPLPSGKRAWFFADTYLGAVAERPGGFYKSSVRNSIVMQDGGNLRTITGGNTCREHDTSIPFWDRYAWTSAQEPGSNAFYWPGDAMVVGDSVVKFYYRNVPEAPLWTDTHSAFATIPLGTLENSSVATIRPTLIAPTYSYGRHPINWGLALLQDGPFVYIYGAGIVDANNNRKLYLARTTPGDLANPAHWVYNLGGRQDRWSNFGDQNAARPVSDHLLVENGFSVAKINDRFWLIQHEPNLNGGNIVAHPATAPWDFGRERIRLYTPPEGPRDAAHRHQFYYEARLHPGLGEPGKVVVSYNVNSTEVSVGCHLRTDHDGDIYRPHFIDVPVHSFDATEATAAAMTTATAPSAGFPRGIRGGTPQVPAGTKVVTGDAKAPPQARSALGDYGWYDSWTLQANGGCPYLTGGTRMASSLQPDGTVPLWWDDYGRDMWYWIYVRDATAGGQFTRRELWTTSRAFADVPVLSRDTQGHVFEWYVVPFASGAWPEDRNHDGRLDSEAPNSNVTGQTVTVQRPAKVGGVSVTTHVPSTGEATVAWQRVMYPSSRVYYFVYYWDVSAGQTEEHASRTAPLDPETSTITLGLTTGHQYGFVVRAENIGGLSDPSDTLYATP